MAKPDIDVTIPVDSEIVGEGAQRIRETRQAILDVFPINPDDLDWEWTENHWPAGSLTGGMDPDVDNENPPTSDQFQDRAFLIADKTLRWDYMIPPEHNALSPGPLDTGPATVTVPVGSTWTVVGDEDLNVQYLRDLEDVDVEQSISGDALIYDHSTNSWYASPAPQGPPGVEGPEGPKGLQGDQGDRGPRGDQGIPGLQGHQGPTGDDGARGPVGPQGTQGEDGAPGAGLQFKGNVPDVTNLPGYPDSYSGEEGDAYYVENTKQIWAWGGATGEWESLGEIEGPQGPQGIQGPEGQQGVPGQKGDQGIDGLQGIQGPEGDQGIPGIQGEPGSQGQQGVPGQDGERGEIGPEGPAGTDYQYSISATSDATSPKIVLTSDQGGDTSDIQLFAGQGITISGVDNPSSVLISSVVPFTVRGMISMWGWNSDEEDLTKLNEANWFLCDGGSNAQAYGRSDYDDCPDMTEYFVRGGTWGSNIGSTAGSNYTNNHTLQQHEMPSHTHTASSNSTGGHTHTTYTNPAGTVADIAASTGPLIVARGTSFPDRNTSADGNHSHTISVGNSGSSGSHRHGMEPLNFKVAYIIYLGIDGG